MVLVSMVLQVLLIFLGAIRYRFAKFILSSVTWISYLSADYVAIYALGLMLHSSLREIGILYAVWAPLLLVHLGGPDTITAYSMIDNELWKRHTLVMFYHLFVAAYLICVSLLPWPLEGKVERSLSLAAILIYLAGATKYVERMMALRFASIKQIVSSTLPIHTFMEEIEPVIDKDDKDKECKYIVSGEKEFFINYRRQVRTFEENFSKKGDSTQKLEENLSKEKANFLKENFSKQKLNEMGAVTVADVWEWEKKQATEDYILCVSHALFKSYMRRFGGLPIRKEDESKTENFFFEHLGSEKVFEVVERELKFTYDYLFSKSSRTAFSKLGTAMRLTNTGLLAWAFFLIFNTLVLLEGQPKHGHKNLVQRVVTYILVSVAAVLEMFQMLRIIFSDWTRVSLVCAHIRHSPGSGSGMLDSCIAMLIKSALFVTRMVHNLRGKVYWQNQIEQYSLTETCLTCLASKTIEKVRCLTRPSTCRGKGRKSKSTPFILGLYIKFVAGWYMKPKPIHKDLKDFILEKIKEYCYEKKNGSTLPSRLLNSIKEEIYEQVDLKLNTETWEREILVWHVATAICQGLDQNAGSKSNHPEPTVCCGQRFVKGVLNFLSCKRNSGDENAASDPVNMLVSETLSKYCGYLLVSYPSMLPLHPDMAKLEHEKLLLEIVPLVRDIKKNNKAEEGSDAAALAKKLMEKGKKNKDGKKTMLNDAVVLAEKLHKMPERWELISQLWSAFMLYYAYFYKATFHGASLAAGGEYISQLWALLAHLGFGEQSDTAVGHGGVPTLPKNTGVPSLPNIYLLLLLMHNQLNRTQTTV